MVFAESYTAAERKTSETLSMMNGGGCAGGGNAMGKMANGLMGAQQQQVFYAWAAHSGRYPTATFSETYVDATIFCSRCNKA